MKMLPALTLSVIKPMMGQRIAMLLFTPLTSPSDKKLKMQNEKE